VSGSVYVNITKAFLCVSISSAATVSDLLSCGLILLARLQHFKTKNTTTPTVFTVKRIQNKIIHVLGFCSSSSRMSTVIGRSGFGSPVVYCFGDGSTGVVGTSGLGLTGTITSCCGVRGAVGYSGTGSTGFGSSVLGSVGIIGSSGLGTTGISGSLGLGATGYSGSGITGTLVFRSGVTGSIGKGSSGFIGGSTITIGSGSTTTGVGGGGQKFLS